MNISTVTPDDLKPILGIEQASFSPELAAGEEQFASRIVAFPDTFLVARNNDDIPVGFVCGPVVRERFIEDWMYEAAERNPAHGGRLMVLSLAVAPQWRGKGVAGMLLDGIERTARSAGRISVALTCLQELIGFYERHGYSNEGVANSTHGNRTWYNMERVLSLEHPSLQ